MAIFIFGLFSFGLVRVALAQTPATPVSLGLTSEVQQNIGLASTDIRVIIAQIIRVALGFLGIIFLVIVLYAGFQWMTSGGNEQKIASAKGLMINGVIGLAIILSAYGITSFIMRMLGYGQGESGGAGVGVSTGEMNFYGSGSLGTVIRDHYPARDQKDVPRNTKIIITFRPAVTSSSFIIDSNRDGIYGDCQNVGLSTFNWETDCDQLATSTDHVDIKQSDTGALIRGASVIASYENGKVYTVVIRPFDYLGSDTVKISYTVRIGKGVLTDDPANNNPSVFAGFPTGRDFYTWNFITDTKLDVTPPHVRDVFPGRNSTEARNTAIQITFDKAMDPSTLQGAFAAGTGVDSNAYILKGNAVFQKVSNSPIPEGAFRLVNNYQTLEFSPSILCGKNACGGNVYCMPVVGSSDGYELLLRAGKTFSGTSFEAMPLSGVMDASGNALDGNNNGKVEVVTSTGAVFPNQERPDNYFWSFTLSNQLDLTPPFINKTTPGPDATFVAPSDEWSMVFSKRMLIESIYNIGIGISTTTIDPPCRSPRVSGNLDGTTNVVMSHCPFSSSDTRIYYYPIVDSRVEDIHFNCLYPGKGPNGLAPISNSSVVCDPSASPTNCCAVDAVNPFCCNGAATSTNSQGCFNSLNL